MKGVFSFFVLLGMLHGGESFSKAIRAGFNQAWFHDHYAGQYLEGDYDQKEVERVFSLARSAGAPLLRLWFFESLDFPQLLWENERIRGIRLDFIQNVIRMLKVARESGVKVYMTLLDAQVYRPHEQNAAERARFKYVISGQGGSDFINHALRPFLSAIDEAGYSGEIERIDLMNEGDAAVDRFGFEGGWKGAGRLLCQWRSAIREQSGFAKTPVTFSIRLAMVLPLPSGIFKDEGAMACADYLDFHSYNNSGEIHGCSRIAKYAASGRKEVILGEYGQSYFNKTYDDELQLRITRKYLDQAERCGFSAALAWRLTDVRPGRNPESRYSYEADSGPRPAFHVIRERNNLKGPGI
jgi:hypothetical protein